MRVKVNILNMKAEITILKFKLPNENKKKNHQPTYCKFAIQKGLETSYAAAPLSPKLERHTEPESLNFKGAQESIPRN